MAKKNSSNPVQLLSPENYIRQKARNLPIHECKVNKSWEIEKFTSVIICRKHANGNFTLCFYLVDLGCLGVKNSFFKFNVDSFEYQEIIDKLNDNDSFINVSYELAHNIVYAALAYSEDLGFKPCKEFTQTTRFMLEEDTDDVELIEIECGENGKPFYINSGFETDTKAQQIINQLEKAVGKGNFDYILGMDGDDIEDDDEIIENDFEAVALGELQDEFLDLLQKDIVNGTQVNAETLRSLTDEICLRVCDDDLIDSYITEWTDETTVEFEDETITTKLVGLDADTPITEKIVKLIDETFDNLTKSDKKATKSLQKLEKEIGKTALTAFLELTIIREDETKNYSQKLNEYSLQYPEYGLIKLFKHVHLQEEKEDVSEFVLPKVSVIFSGYDKITDYEFYQFLSEKTMLIFKKKDLNISEAFYTFLDDLYIADSLYEKLSGLVSISRMFLLVEYFEYEDITVKKETKLKIVHPQSQSKRAFQFKIQLMHINKPPVWRRIVLADDASFDEFHNAIQVAFGWENYHLYNFTPQGWGTLPVITLPSDYDDGPIMDAIQTELKDVFSAVGNKFRYIYDFGDNWSHQIELEEIQTDFNKNLPICIDGKGTCPPEDCGGIMGYERLKEVLANKKDPEHKDMLSWLGLSKGSDWDVNAFDIEAVNEKMREL